jgi:hypothetical protein
MLKREAIRFNNLDNRCKIFAEFVRSWKMRKTSQLNMEKEIDGFKENLHAGSFSNIQ